jgi:lysyl-tRNA synthetase class II
MPNWPAIREHLGLTKNAKPDRIRNAIIRSQFVGGEDLMTALESVDRLTKRLKDSGHPHQAHAAESALRELQRLRDMMHDAASVWIERFGDSEELSKTSRQWQVGDTYYQACGEMHGKEWDLCAYAEECRTKAEAQENADQWFGGLTKIEQRYAKAYVLRYRIVEIDEDGSIGYAESY